MPRIDWYWEKGRHKLCSSSFSDIAHACRANIDMIIHSQTSFGIHVRRHLVRVSVSVWVIATLRSQRAHTFTFTSTRRTKLIFFVSSPLFSFHASHTPDHTYTAARCTMHTYNILSLELLFNFIFVETKKRHTCKMHINFLLHNCFIWSTTFEWIYTHVVILYRAFDRTMKEDAKWI